MIQIAIVEDDAQERVRLKTYLNKFAEQENVQLSVSEYASGWAFLEGYHPKFDIVLMDIEMPGMDGMETARNLRKIDGKVILIFVTNLAQYAVSGYEVDALDFIVKPVNPQSFVMKMRRAITRTTKKTEDMIQVRTDRENTYLMVSAIKYLEVSGHYVIYHTTGGDLSEYTTMKEAMRKIEKPFFARCNQSYLVNLRYVTAVKKDTVIVDGDELTISRPQKKKFLMAFSEFLGGAT